MFKILEHLWYVMNSTWELKCMLSSRFGSSQIRFVIRVGIQKMLVSISNRIDSAQTALQKQSEMSLCCLFRPFGAGN